MTWLSTFGDENDNSNLLTTRGVTKQAPEAGAFDGLAAATGKGVMKGAARVGQTVALAGGAAAVAADVVTGQDDKLSDWYFKNVMTPTVEAGEYWTPDAQTTGIVGKVAGGFVETLYPLLLGPAGAPSMVAAAQTGQTIDLSQQGVDPETAISVGAFTGMATAVGFKVAGFGSTLTKKIVTGTTGNVAMGGLQDFVSQAELKHGGYNKIAERYDPLDPTSRTLDVLLGAAFSGIEGYSGKVADQDAVLAAKNSYNYTQKSAVGQPVNPESHTKHQAALDEAIRAMTNGEKVDVIGMIDGAEFIKQPRQVIDAEAAAREAFGSDMPAAERFVATNRLADMMPEQRKALKYDDDALNEYAAKVEKDLGLPAGLLNAIKNAGERSNSNQVSPKGARGVMQFIGDTAKGYGLTDATDPLASIDAAGRYMSDLMKRYKGNVDAAITEYNGGVRQARAVESGKAPWVKETINYLDRVRGYMDAGVQPKREPTKLAKAEPMPETIEAVKVMAETPEAVTRPIELSTPEQAMAILGDTAQPARVEPVDMMTIKQQSPELVQADFVAMPDVIARPDDAVQVESGGAIYTKREGDTVRMIETAQDGRVIDYKVVEPRQAAQVMDARSVEPIAQTKIETTQQAAPRDAISDIAATAASMTSLPRKMIDSVANATRDVVSRITGQEPQAKAEPAKIEPKELSTLREQLKSNPEMMIHAGIDADGNSIMVRAADAMAEIEAEYKADMKEAQSYEVAALCYLGNGD